MSPREDLRSHFRSFRIDGHGADVVRAVGAWAAGLCRAAAFFERSWEIRAECPAFFLKKSAEHSAFFAEFFAESEPKKNPSILLLLPSRTRRGLG